MRSLSNYDGDVNENSKKSMEQQLCTCITLFCTLLSRCCTTTTENLPIKFDVFKRTWTQNNHFFIYIYICTRFQKVFHIEIYIDRYIWVRSIGKSGFRFWKSKSKKTQTTCSFQIGTKNPTKKKSIIEPSFFTSWTIANENCTQAHVQENKCIYLSIYLSIWKPFWKWVYIYIYINIRNRKKTTLLSRQACFVIAHSSGDLSRSTLTYRALYYGKIVTQASYIYIYIFVFWVERIS